jgi:hypothetical protein
MELHRKLISIDQESVGSKFIRDDITGYIYIPNIYQRAHTHSGWRHRENELTEREIEGKSINSNHAASLSFDAFPHNSQPLPFPVFCHLHKVQFHGTLRS